MTNFFLLEIIDMNQPSQKIKLVSEANGMVVQFYNFNTNGELILIYHDLFRFHFGKFVFVYSIQTKKSKCQKFYHIPKEAKVISLSKDDKIWLYSNNNIYEWN